MRVGEDQRGRLFTELLYVEFELRPPPAGKDPRSFYLAEYPAFADQIRGMSFSSELNETVHFARSDDETEKRPRTFSRFQLEKSVGRGGMGEVWKAYDPRLDRHVAVKIPRKALPSDEDLHRFIREGRAAAQLRHPNIVPGARSVARRMAPFTSFPTISKAAICGPTWIPPASPIAMRPRFVRPSPGPYITRTTAE